MTVEQRHCAKQRVLVQRVDHHEMTGRRQRRDGTAKGEQVRLGRRAITDRNGLFCKQIDNGEILRRCFEKSTVRRQGISSRVTGIPPLGTQINPALQAEP